MSKNKVSVKVLTWEGHISIERTSELKIELMDAIEKAAQIVVSLSLVESLDISAIQLLLAAQAEASHKNKSFHLTGSLKAGAVRALLLAGFIHTSRDNARDIEVEFFGQEASSKEH